MNNCRILFIIVFLASCSQIQERNFKRLSTDNFFDTEFKIEKSNKAPKQIQIIKFKNFQEFIASIVSISTKKTTLKPAHYIEFGTDQKYIVDELFIKNISEKNNCQLSMFVDIANVHKINMRKDFSEIKYEEKNGWNYFVCVFLCESNTEQ